jgi:WD40 repeat protein
LESGDGRAASGTPGAAPEIEVVVADMQSIRGFDGDSGAQVFFQPNVFGTGEMGGITNVAVDTSNGTNLILTSWLDGTVKVWNPKTRKLVMSHPDLEQPVSAIRYGEWLVITEHGRGRVIAIGPNDPINKMLLVSGLPAPTGLVVRDGDLFVTDRVRGEILRIATGGEPVRRVTTVASGLASPEGIAATPAGFLIIEGESGRLLEVTMNGEIRVVATIPKAGAEAPTSRQPPSMIFNGVAISREGVIFATGERSRTIYRIDPSPVTP